MTTAQQVLDVARSQLGVTEAPDGSTPYHREYGLAADQPWCAVFMWWCFRRAGAADLIHPKTAYAPTLADWYRTRRAFDANPHAGDLVFYDWPDSVRRIQHVGIVEAVEPTAIVTIEGNTSTANQGNGGQVMRRRRARGSSIVGYGHPAFPASAPPISAPQEADMPLNAQDLEAITGIVRKEVAAAVWNAPIPDFYQQADPKTGQRPAMPAYAALGYATARSATASEAANHAAARTDEIADRATQPGGTPPDYDAFIRTFAAELLKRLT